MGFIMFIPTKIIPFPKYIFPETIHDYHTTYLPLLSHLSYFKSSNCRNLEEKGACHKIRVFITLFHAERRLTIRVLCGSDNSTLRYYILQYYTWIVLYTTLFLGQDCWLDIFLPRIVHYCAEYSMITLI